MQQPAKRINIEDEKKKNTRIAIGIAAFGIVCGIFLYMAMFVMMFAFPFAVFKIIPMLTFSTDLISVKGSLILITGEIDFSGASFAQEPRERAMMKKLEGGKLSEPVEIAQYSSLDVANGKAYFFSEGRYMVFDGVSWEEFDHPAIGRNPQGAVGPDGLWILSEIGNRKVLSHIAGDVVEQVPLPKGMEEGEQSCSYNPGLLWTEGGLNMFWKEGGTLYHDRYDGTSWRNEGNFKSPTSYEIVGHGANIYLFTHDVGSEIQVRRFDGNAWSAPRGLGIGQTGLVLDFDVTEADDRMAVVTQSFFSEKLCMFGDGKVSEPISLKSPMKFSITGRMLLLNGGFFAFTALLVFAFSTVINRYKFRYWPLKRGRAQFASIFRRFLAYAVDSVIVSLPLVALWFLVLEKKFPPDDPFTFIGIVIVAIVGFLLWVYLYYSLMEGLWGRTAGKWICGIKVLRDNFTKCGLGRAFLRNLLRVVDAMFYYFVGLIAIGATLKWQRLGDIAAGTVVVRARRLRKRQVTAPPPRAAGQVRPLGPRPRGYS